MISIIDFVSNIRNVIDFKLRQFFYFSRKNYKIKNEDKAGMFFDDTVSLRESELFEKYELSLLKNHSTVHNYLENLYLLDLMDRYLVLKGIQSASVLDIGCKNWFYVHSEYAYFTKCFKTFNLDGIELDPNRLYTNLYSRKEAAKAYMNGLDDTSYIEGDFLEHNKKYDYLIWILPFVFEYPHQKWGLPKKYFKPKEMLAHSFELLNDGGKIFILNQGADEYETQKALCDELSLKYIDIGLVESKFLQYKYDRYLIIISK